MPSLRPVAVLWRLFAAVAQRWLLIVALSGVLTFLGCLGISVARGGDPLPEIHDEYAYLLAGDTFAHGRLTNPPVSYWRSIETFQELQQPSRQAKYPPGQGLFLALGQVLTGRPIVGVWISCSLFASALCWMLYAWLPPRWAVLGTLLGVVTTCFCGRDVNGGALAYWSQSYWGGAPAALGGALLFGGLGSAIRWRGCMSGAALGVGAAILALTRPYEGMFAVLVAGAIGATVFVRARPPPSPGSILRVALPAVCIVALALVWLGYDNARVTGVARRFPYAEYDRQYEIAPLWRWQSVREEPPGLNRQMHDFAHLEVISGQSSVNPDNRVGALYSTLAFDVGPLIAPLVILLLPWACRSRVGRAAAVGIGGIAAGTFLVMFYQTHYLAPAAPVVILLATASLRRLTLIRRGPQRAGLALALLLIAATVANAGREWAVEARSPQRLMSHWAAVRENVASTLTERGGRHVVFVRYGLHHNPHVEVVFNGADIDGQPVLWARDLGPDHNRVVLDAAPDRAPWLLDIEEDQATPRVLPYGGK